MPTAAYCSTPINNLMRRVQTVWNHVCSEQDPLTNFKGLKTVAKSVGIATVKWVSSCLLSQYIQCFAVLVERLMAASISLFE